MGSSDLVKLDWSVPNLGQFLLAVLVASIAARIFHAALRAIKLAFDSGWSWRRYGLMFRRSLIGFHPAENGRAPSTDYGYTFILGTIELLAYPILAATGAWTAIGAWIGLKALAQWGQWKEDRSVFNLFLIGNAVNVLISVVLLARFVSTT
jgi:hypothetical protein